MTGPNHPIPSCPKVPRQETPSLGGCSSESSNAVIRQGCRIAFADGWTVGITTPRGALLFWGRSEFYKLKPLFLLGFFSPFVGRFLNTPPANRLKTSITRTETKPPGNSPCKRFCGCNNDSFEEDGNHVHRKTYPRN